jgi:hypothetical protein
MQLRPAREVLAAEADLSGSVAGVVKGPELCSVCGRGPFRRLATHIRRAHAAGEVERPATNVMAVESTIAALREAGRLSDTDDALVALARNLAAVVDGDSGNASLWREFRSVVQSLREVGADDIDDDTAAFRISIRTPLRATVGDTS